jgi:hypothetical protein
MSTDPYASPATPAYSSSPSDSAVSAGALQQLAGTKPWVRFISVLMFVGAGLMVLGGIAMMFAGAAIFKNSPNPAPLGAIVGIVYLVFAILYIYPALKLWNYASGIAILLASGSVMDLEGALNQQRSFWKFIGVMMLAVLVLYALIAVIGIIGTVFMSMKASGH